MILALRADSADATVALIDNQGKIVHTNVWAAGRQLSAELMPTIKKSFQSAKADWNDISGVIVFEGPGSFTGLRISLTVANTIAYSLGCPVVGSGGDDWILRGLKLLKTAHPGQIALPHYGAEPNITHPKS